MQTIHKVQKFNKNAFFEGLASFSLFPAEEKIPEGNAWNRVFSCFKSVENNLESVIYEQADAYKRR